MITSLVFTLSVYQLFSVEILLKATGNAPIVKKKKWLVEQDRTIGSVLNFFRRYLKLDPAESLVSNKIYH